MTGTPFDAGAEFDRQVQTLVGKGYPELAGLTEAAFRRIVAPLREVALGHGSMTGPGDGRVPFLLVISVDLIPAERTVPLITLPGRRRTGIVDRNFADGELPRFAPIKELGVPDRRAYLVFDVERGEEYRNVRPDDALTAIAARGRTPIAIDEGIAFVTQYPDVLAKNKCFSLAGARCGDRRVPALWISQGAPKLGWCFAGVPHTWLGCASGGARAGAGSLPSVRSGTVRSVAR